PPVASPESFALCAMMYLHAARLPARVSGGGDFIALADQDRNLWDDMLIAKGRAMLDQAASGFELSEYHIEAAIAYVHSSTRSPGQTDWPKIIWLYDTLMKVRPSPVVALNRAIAIAQQNGPEAGIKEINAIAESSELASYPFFPAALGELELRAGRMEAAREHFTAAAGLARNPMERRFLKQRAEATTLPESFG
ncbi:MAG: hypothetical protein M3N19_01985, partial [Candidatus Eremiobacteraeota bacterium]|nr:hypothetical protein [Candidatus Eremiobacteraeota bacterium]